MFRTLKTIIQFQKRQDGCKMGQRIMKSWANSLNKIFTSANIFPFKLWKFLAFCFHFMLFWCLKKGTENRLNLKAFYLSYSVPLLFKVLLCFVCMCVFFVFVLFVAYKKWKKKNYKRKY